MHPVADRNLSSLPLIVLGLAALAGCATPVERRPNPAHVGNAGSGWAAVLPTPEVAAAAFNAGPDFARQDLTRRDYALGVADTDALPPGSWPDDTRPSLERQRRITLSTQSQTFIYFRPFAGPGPSDHGHR